MNPIEIAATALGFVNQWLAIRQHIWCWPVGIASVLGFAFVFYDAKLYSDAGLQVFYIVLQGVGWVRWRSHAAGLAGRRSLLPVSMLSWRARLLWASAAAAAALLLGGTMRSLTDASMPFADAAATSLSLVGQWLQARKVLDSWAFFIAGNLIFLVLYVGKGLYATTLLFVFLTAMAVLGFVRWRRSMLEDGEMRVAVHD
jgi:nicotinamide mononucleotide transporter